MKKIVCLLLISIPMYIFGNTDDSLKIVTLQKEISTLKATVSRLQQENGKIHGLYEQQKAIVDSLSDVQKQQSENLVSLSKRLGDDLAETNNRIDNNASSLSNSIKSRTWAAFLGILIALVMLGVVYYYLRKKILNASSSIDKIKTAQDSLAVAQKAMQEESVKMDTELIELLDKQLSNIGISNAMNLEIDHSFALKIGDEITKMEVNLSRMDPTIRGYKILCRSIQRIKDNFKSREYEIVDMLGKPYNEGMKVVANFVFDDTLAEGEQKITGIIKPQINYKGKMIQAAQITVSQNL